MSIVSKCYRLGELTVKSGKIIRERGFRAFFYKSRSYVRDYLSRHFAPSSEPSPIGPRSVSDMIRSDVNAASFCGAG